MANELILGQVLKAIEVTNEQHEKVYAKLESIDKRVDTLEKLVASWKFGGFMVLGFISLISYVVLNYEKLKSFLTSF